MSHSNPGSKGGKAATLISRKLLDQAKSAKNARVTPKGKCHFVSNDNILIIILVI